MSYDHLDNGDIGFKVLENENHPSPDERLCELPYLFRRSEIVKEVRTTLSHTLYLRNKKRREDYMIKFRSTADLATFLKLFPKRAYNDRKTAEYYIMPHPEQ